MRICIVADNASARFGGEAILPLHYFRLLRQRGVEVWLVVHDRVRGELETLLPNERDRMRFVSDTAIHRLLFRLSGLLPRRIAESTLGLVMLMYTQWTQRRMVQQLIREHGIDVLHQPAPVAPSYPSLFFGLGRPLIIGPMNGGMDYPPAFRSADSLLSRIFVALARPLTAIANRLLPGKRNAAVLLVANQRTAAALPAGYRGRVVELVENGVDLVTWNASSSSAPKDPNRFVFMGRLVDWKALPIVFEAMTRVPEAALVVIGDGAMREPWEAETQRLGLGGRVHFRGWKSQRECAQALAAATALVLPSLYECGGAVVLEAMAMGRPVIATAWGGPADYLDSQTGFLIPPESHEVMVAGFADAMECLIDDPELATGMGMAARRRVLENFTWQMKIDRILEIYRSVLSTPTAPPTPVFETTMSKAEEIRNRDRPTLHTPAK
ncbi:MAG TPA: glycosyltransferase family 4 protein [Acidobacteriaceae bacterium]|jgi:glycosyltransferase involved in cell wall biosynthesis